MTNLVGITRVKNEADFIEYFVRHNCQVLDSLYILDDRSTDNTIKIINSLMQENLKIEVLSINDRNTRILNLQGPAMTDLMRYAATKQNSSECYIFALDADEVIIGKRDNIVSQLETLCPDEYGLIKWKTFAPINGGLVPNKPIQNHFKPLLKEQAIFYKVVVPIQHSHKVDIAMGNHDLDGNEVLTGKIKPRILEIQLGHFPVRSADQIISKALVASHKTMMKKSAGAPMTNGENLHIIALANYLRSLNFKPSSSDLTKITLDYLHLNESTTLDQAFNMEEAFAPIKTNYIARIINPITALDDLLQDVINADNNN